MVVPLFNKTTGLKTFNFPKKNSNKDVFLKLQIFRAAILYVEHVQATASEYKLFRSNCNKFLIP